MPRRYGKRPAPNTPLLLTIADTASGCGNPPPHDPRRWCTMNTAMTSPNRTLCLQDDLPVLRGLDSEGIDLIVT